MALPILPGRRQPSIVGRDELNYRVRYGNGWTLILISTNYCQSGFPETTSILYNSQRALSRKIFGDPYRIRTDVNGVRGRCLNHLTNGPRRRHKLRSARFRLSVKARHAPLCLLFGQNPLRWAFARSLGHFAQTPLIAQLCGTPALWCARGTPQFGMVRLHGLEPGTH